MSPEPATRITVDVDGRTLSLSNLDKVLAPEVGFTKGEVIDYYSRIGPVLLPHLADRPITFRRYPNGVDDKSFFEKNAAARAPEWIRSVRIPTPGSTKDRDVVDFVLIDDLAGLVWAANLAALELHTPMWRVVGADRQHPDLLVFDLDPGAPADITTCCQVALMLRELLGQLGLQAWPKTSGSKGMQLYVPLDGEAPWQDVHAFARAIASLLEEQAPKLITSTMSKELRTGKILIDWSQNNAAKTTVSVYSLRARPRATASTPITWDEVTTCKAAADLSFTAADVLARVESEGDVFSGVLIAKQPLPDVAGR